MANNYVVSVAPAVRQSQAHHLVSVAEFLHATPREEWEEAWWEGVVPYLPVEDVGAVCQLYVEMANAMEEFAERMEGGADQMTINPIVQPLEQSQDMRLEKIRSILERPQVAQRTEQWYLEGLKYLTGSQFSQLFASPYMRGQLVVEKAGLTPPAPRSNRLVCTIEETGPFDWGIRFEPVVRAVYMDLTKTVVADVGRLYHGTLGNLAASPDGLVIEAEPGSDRLGRLVEYKAPPTRKLLQKVPKEYYMQMQVQMEVADIDACDYCEMKFFSPYKGKMTEAGTTEKHYRGWVALIMRDGMLDRYEYSPFGVVGNAWAAELKDVLEETERVYELIPWALEEYYLETVPRDRGWWASVQPTVDTFWTDVEAARAGTWVAPQANPRKKRKTEGEGGAAPTLEIQDDGDD